MSLLSVRGVRREFAVEGGIFRRRIGGVRALRGVSFDLDEGQSLGLVGESGSGKTTLGRIVARLLRPDAGQVLWEGRPQEAYSPGEWARQVQMMFQDPAASLNPKLSVRTVLGEALGAGGADPRPMDERMRDLLETVGLPGDVLFYYPHQFSGGQRQRLALARALAVRPRLLVADEPVSALDLSIQAQILNLLMDLKKRFRLTTLVISHDLAVISHLADRLLVLKDGEAVEAGPTDRVLSRPEHPYTRSLLEAVPALLR